MRMIVVVSALAACSLAYGQAGQKKADAPKKTGVSVAETLKQIERDWVKAGQTKDAAALDAILADDWTAIEYDGQKENKAQAMADLKATDSSLQSITLGEMTVKVLGSAAIVQGSDTEKSTYKGKDSSGKYLWMDVFVNRNGKWQAVASESTKVP